LGVEKLPKYCSFFSNKNINSTIFKIKTILPTMLTIKTKKIFLPLLTLLSLNTLLSQTNPVITSWLLNTTNIYGRHYVSGNSTPIQDSVLANVQKVQYSASSVYISTQGIPSYITGPFIGNPSIAEAQNAIFKLPLSPQKNTGTLANTTGGNIGIFINGVALFDFRDAVSWQFSSSSLKGGPAGGTGDGVWNRDAVIAERNSFDCAKAHPANGNYHHHQNPSAFNFDFKVLSNICNLYASDGLYKIDSTVHSPLIGYAYDGFPIYGAYAYKNVDGTGGIVRMKSSYNLRNITIRTTYSDGTTVTGGPDISTTYPLGYFREDYQYNTTSAATPDYLDEHNGRFCKTPEYPNGIFCYFATVDANRNSAYPYAVGPTFYGTRVASKVATITETVTNYTPAAALSVSISSNTTSICSGTSLTFTAKATNGGTSPSFQWKKNGINVGTNSTTYTDNALANGDVITCVITSTTSATSNNITLTVNPSLTPSVSIATSATTICSGTNTSFTATSTNGGTIPSYQWKKNGTSVGMNSNTYSDIALVNGDMITCVLTSNATCATTTTANSNSLSMTVNANVTPTISINTPTTSINKGAKVTFTATATNGGTAPTYQWKKNGITVGTNSNTYLDSTMVNNDVISCVVTSNALCKTTSTAMSNTITMVVKPTTGIHQNGDDAFKVSIFPVPATDAVIIQMNDVVKNDFKIALYDISGKLIEKTFLYQGSTLSYFDTQRLYNGEYFVHISNGVNTVIKKVIIVK
jgi:hypothetical protein